MTSGSVYLFGSEDGNPVKVGWSTDVEARIGQLRSGHPWKLRIIGAWWMSAGAGAAERHTHRLLKAHRMHGEWFSCSIAEAEAAIERAVAEVAADPVLASKHGRKTATRIIGGPE